MPVVSEIPEASALQLQLEQILKAIDAIDVAGTNVPIMTIQPGPPADPNAPNAYLMSISLTLEPPISDMETLGELQTALQLQSEAVQQRLIDMGYIDDVSMKYGQHQQASAEEEEMV